MKSFWLVKTGERAELELREVPIPQLAAGRLLVRMKATSLNRGDLLARIKRHSAQGGRPAGIDGSGEVVDAGGTSFKPGERVMFRAHACFAEYVLVDPALAAPVPDNLSWEEAAAIPAAFITAWEAVIQFGRLRAGESLLLVGASSGVGVAALQIAKAMGAWVIGVSGSAEKLVRLKALGLDASIHARRGEGVSSSDFAEELLWITRQRGIDVAVNLAGGTAFPACVRVAADFGRIIVVGYVDGVLHADIDLETVHGRRLQICGISNTPLTPAQRALAHDGFMRDVYPAIAEGKIKPVIDRVFAFDELPAAKAYVDTDQFLGKVVVRLP